MSCFTGSLQWPADDQALNIASECVHVWRTRYDPSPESVRFLRQTLSPDELERAGRFTLPDRRDRFILARGTLRRLLGRYLDLDPADLRFDYGVWGKPMLGKSQADSGLRFNLSHSFDMILVAVAKVREVGVDVEWIGRKRPVLELARRFFPQSEADSLCTLPEAEQVWAFFGLWTRSEALLKAGGQGLELLAPSRTLAESERVSQMSVRSFDLCPDYRAAVAAEGSGWKLMTGGVPELGTQQT